MLMESDHVHNTEAPPSESVPITVPLGAEAMSDDEVYEDSAHDSLVADDHHENPEAHTRMAIEDPSIEPARPATAGTTMPCHHHGPTPDPRAAGGCLAKQRGKISSAAAKMYGQPIPQTAFLQHLKQRERDLNAIIREKYYQHQGACADGDDVSGAKLNRPTSTSRASPVASSTKREDAAVSATTRKSGDGTPMAPSERLERMLASFPTSAVRDPFCPKPPVHASTIRLEASVEAVKRMFPRVATESAGASRIASARGSTYSANNALPRPHTAEAALPILITSPSFVPPAATPTPVQPDSSPSSGARTAPIVAVETTIADGKGSDRPHLRNGGRPTLRSSRPSTTETTSRHALDTLVQFLPEGYREPEILLKDKPLVHPHDPVTGAPRPCRRYRLGLQHDPANNVDPAEAIEALQNRKLPTTLSIASTDPAVLALVDAFIESTPGLEQVDLGAMDDRYEMVLRNVYAALSRNVSVGVVTGVFPKEATRAFKSTISANTECRERRIAQLAGKERELKIADMERRILRERQEKKKLQFEQMRQRTRFCDRHARSHRELLRTEGEAWQGLCEVEGASLQDVREKERLRFDWWTASVQTLEELMSVMRGHDSREEHQEREVMRLEEVNQRLAAQVELRKYQKQLDNDRHVIFAEQFERRKHMRLEEKKLRRQIESVLVDHLRVFLDERAREERRRREEEARRQQDESYKAYRLRQLQQNQEVLETNELERRKSYEVEAWKSYDLFKRKHFEGIVVAKNQQRVREIREKRQAAFTAADSAVPSLHFRMTPQTISNATTSSTTPSASNTLTYMVNTIGDYHVLNTGATLGVQFDTDLSALTIKQKTAKAEPQGGIISCRIMRSSWRDIEEGREGIVLFVSTAAQLDPNVQITGHVEREPGKVLATPASQKERLLDSTPVATSVSPQTASKSQSHHRRQRSPSMLSPQQAHLSPQRGQEDTDAANEEAFSQLCGDNRIFGVLRVRDEADDHPMSKRSSARSRASTNSLTARRTDGPRLTTADGVRESDMLDPYVEELATESDSDSDSISSSSSGKTRAPKRGYGSVMVSEVSGPPKRPKRRVVSWNGRDVGVVELGYAGAPIDTNRMTPYYLNTAIHKVRSKKSAITMQIRKRRGTLDVVENSSPLDDGLRNNSTVFGSYSTAISTDVDDDGGVEVFRMRLFQHCPRHAVSDILAHLSYFNSAGAVNMAHPTMETLASNEIVKVATNVSIAFRRSCLPPSAAHPAHHTQHPGSPSQMMIPATPTSPPQHVRNGGGAGGFLSTPESTAFRRESDLSDGHSMSSGGFHDVSLLVWSTRTTNTFVKMQLPLFFGQPQREPIYFLEDQRPLPLCRTNTFGWCFPVQASVAASYDVAAAAGLRSESPLRPNNFGSSVFGRDASLSGNGFVSLMASSVSEAPAALNYLTNGNKHVVVRDHSDETLDAIEVLIGKHAAHGLHMYLSITGHSRGDVFVMLESCGLALGSERVESYVPVDAEVGANQPYGRRLVECLSDCSKKQVGVEVTRTVRELYYRGELVALVEGLMLSPKEFAEYGECFTSPKGDEHESSNSELSMTLPSLLLEASALVGGPIPSGSGGPTPGGSGRSLTHLRTIRSFSSARQGPVSIHFMSNRFVTLLFLRDLITSVAYSNLNKDPSPIKRHVDVCLTDKYRRGCSLVRSEITVVPVDDITEINLATPPWGFRVWRAPTETKPELQQYLPAEPPFFIAPDATAEDPDSVYFDGGWLEVEIVDGVKDGDVLYLLQDDRLFIEHQHTWNLDTIRQASKLYSQRQVNAHDQALARDCSLEVCSPAAQHHGMGFGLVPAALEETYGGGLFQEGHTMMSAAMLPSPHSSRQNRTSVETEAPLGGARDAPQPPRPVTVLVDETVYPRISMPKFTDDDNEPHSEFVVTSGLALDEIPPLVSRREMSRGRNSGSFSVQATPQGNALMTPDHTPLRPPALMMPGFQGRLSMMPDIAGASGVENLERHCGQGLHYTSPMLRIEFKTLSLAALQYLLRHIAFKSVAASEKNPKYFGTRTIEVRAIVGDPNVQKFRKFDPFVPIVHQTKVKVCEPLLKTVHSAMNYKEGQGTMGIAVGLCEPGTDGYRCFNRGYFAASIVKGVTPDDRILIRSVDPSQFDYGLSFLDLDPLALYQPKRSSSLHNLKRASSMRAPSTTPPQPEKPGTYTPGVGGVGPDGEVNANCPPPPTHLAQQWAKAIATGKYKFQQWKCCEVYNNERAMLGCLTSTYSELFLGLRESDKVRKFGKAVAATAASPAQPSPSAPAQPIPQMGSVNAKKSIVGDLGGPPPTAAPPVVSAAASTSTTQKKKKGGRGDKSNWALGMLADKESKAIPVPLPEGATPIRYTDILSLTKLISYENRSSNPTDLKKVVLLSLSDEHTVSHLVMELTVQPVDDATEIRKAFSGPLLYRHGFPGSYVALFDHCTLFDPDTEEFNGGYLNVAMTHVPADGDIMRFMTLDEQRRHREVVLKDAFAKYRGKPTNQRGGGAADGNTTPNKNATVEPVARRSGRSPIRPKGRGSALEATKEPTPPAKVPPPEAEKDPNEPYEFVVDHRRKVIYWLDRSSLAQTSVDVTAPTPSHGGRFVQSGAFARESPRNSTADKSQARILGDEGVLRRIATFSANTDSRKKQGAVLTSAFTNEHTPAEDSNAFSCVSAPPEISVTDGTDGPKIDDLVTSSTGIPDASTYSAAPPGTPRPPGSLNVQVKIDKLINEEDVEEGEDPERPAPVTLNMLQALMRTIVFANTGPTAKVKPGTRHFSAKIAAAGGGEEGRTRIAVQTSGSLIGWTDNVAPAAVFRPRLMGIQPLQRLLFLNDIIVKSGFLLIEISEGFEPTDDVLKINDIGRLIVVKNGKLFLQPKDQLIGVLSPVEVDGATQGFLIAFDSNCRVSGSILQNLCRSVSYANSSRRTGVRKLRVTMCDGCLYETSMTEVTINVEQDEHTIPVRYGASGGSAVWMEGLPAVHVFPDIQFTLKGPNVGRVLQSPSVLEVETQSGGVLSFGPSDDFEVDAEGRMVYQNEEVARVFQFDPECLQPRQPLAAGGQRRSFARSSFAQPTRRESSLVSHLVDSGGVGGGSGTPSPLNTPAIKSPRKALSPRHSVGAGHTFQRPAHCLRIEFVMLPMELLEDVVRCIQFTCALSSDSRRDSGSTEGGGSETTAPVVNSTGGSVSFSSSRNVPTRSKSVVKIENALERRESSAAMTATTGSQPTAGLPSQFSVMMQLTGIANDVGKVSSIPALHIQGVIRICDGAALFSVPQGIGVQGPAGDIFNNVAARFAPQWIRITWRAALEEAPDEEDLEEAGKRDARNRLSITAAAGLQLGVSGRLGLVISASGEDISYGRDRVATVMSGDLYARSKSLFLSSRKSGSQASSKRKQSLEGEAPTDDFLCAAPTMMKSENDEEFHADDDEGGSNFAFGRGPHSFALPRSTAISQQLIFQINSSRKVNADIVTRLLRSIVCVPPIAFETQFTICFEASEECSTTRTLTVGPYTAGRRSSRASFSMSSTGRGLARQNSQRKSSIHGLAPTIVLVERVGRKTLPKL